MGKRKNDLKIIKSDARLLLFFVFAAWLITALLGFLFLLAHKNGLEELNELGGFMNLVTSMTGVLTIYLLAKAVIYQKEELISIKKLMNKQNNSLKKEEKTNRTVREIEKYRKDKNATHKGDVASFKADLHRISWVLDLKSNGLDKYINQKIIISTIGADLIRDELKSIEFSLDMGEMESIRQDEAFIYLLETYELGHDGQASCSAEEDGEINHWYELCALVDESRRCQSLLNDLQVVYSDPVTNSV